ncbi:hypothetical protein CMO89_03130 [Candidatus Woesearchaeota archaeon]|jgi:hypothetical protein|nr:hypothetical protein [Candidatus Woesearchaeota archaeon]
METKNTEDTGKNMPEKKFRAGAVCATIWENMGKTKEGEPTAYKTISVERNYKDKNDEWKSTNSFRVNDLPRLSLVLSKAYEHVALKDMTSSNLA